MKFLYIAMLTNILGARVSYAQSSSISSITLRPSPTSTTTFSNASATGTSCVNNVPSNRSVWCNYTIDTDYENVNNVPNTGVTREYWLEANQVDLSPDGGVPRSAMTVNCTFPGPTIFADWGDMVVVHVTNKLKCAKNGSSIHWHGIRQYHTNQSNGVVLLTHCPIAPGSSMTYKWRAVQYVSSWYHSHIGLQAWEGVFGGIVINGPATANYDVDMGSIFLSDWTDRTVDSYLSVEESGPTFMNNGLINGTIVNSSGAGSRFTMKVDEGKSYRLRIVNPAIDTHWDSGIANHNMTVIAMDFVDFVPIEPYTTANILTIHTN